MGSVRNRGEKKNTCHERIVLMENLKVEEVIAGCKTLDFSGERIVFGTPSDIVKYFAIQHREIGHVFVLPDKLYDRGTIQSVEFPLYKHIFDSLSRNKGKFTIIGTVRQFSQIHDILQQTVLGPTEEQTRQWSLNNEADFVLKVRSFFRRDFTRLDEILDFIAFDEENCARYKEITIERRGRSRFLVSRGNDRVEVDISPPPQQSPPVDYVPPSKPIRPMRLGAIVLGTSSGFDPRGDTSNIIVFAKHLGISIDGSPWMGERLNLYGISPDSIRLFIVTHLHDDHSNIFEMIVKGCRSRIATTNLIYHSFLVKASRVLNVPIAGVERLIDFVELKPGRKIRWFSNDIECFYTVHPIPTIGVCINDRILISGDTLWGAQLSELVREGIVDDEYCSFMNELLRRPGLELIFMDGGGGQIHPEPAELMSLPVSVREKMYLTHMAEIPPGVEEKLKIGRPGLVEVLDDKRENLDFEDVLALSESTLMKGTSPEWIRVFCSMGKVIEESAHRIIVKEDEMADYFYFLLQGTLKVMQGEEIITRIHSGDYFGEMVFLGSRKRTASILSESPVKLLAIPQEIFQSFIADETVKQNLIKIMQCRPNFFHSSVFKDTPQQYLQQIILNSAQRSYGEGEVIVREGDMGDELFIIMKGSCEVSRVVNECRIVVKILDRGDIFGEMAILSDSKVRRATVTALEPTDVAIVTREYIQEMSQIIPSIFYNLAVVMDERGQGSTLAGQD